MCEKWCDLLTIEGIREAYGKVTGSKGINPIGVAIDDRYGEAFLKDIDKKLPPDDKYEEFTSRLLEIDGLVVYVIPDLGKPFKFLYSLRRLPRVQSIGDSISALTLVIDRKLPAK